MKSYCSMDNAFPFYSAVPNSGIYHTHPRCRIAQRIALKSRVAGTGEGRHECPFCFLLAQFQANRALCGHPPNLGRGTASSATSERLFQI